MTVSTFTMTRHFNAPPALVWRCWTEPDLVGRWYGPGVQTKVHKFDPSEGGVWLHEMIMGEQSMYQRMEYIEVSPPSKLVMLMSNADANWNVIASPMMPNWPRTLLTQVRLTAEGDGTQMVLDWTPHEATAEEVAAFEAAMASLDQGWGQGMDILADILDELQA